MDAQQLLDYKNWAVVGDVLNSSKYASRIFNSLKESGYNVYGVNPKSNDKDIYNNLNDINFNIDVIDLCINPLDGFNIVKEASTIGIKKILIQPGAESKEILNFCKEKGIIAVEGCVLLELPYYKRKKR